MARKSKIDRLDPAIQRAVEELRARGRSCDEVLAHLRALDLPPDAIPVRSGVIAHLSKLDAMVAEARKRRLVVAALTPAAGEVPPQMRHILELFMSAASDLLMSSESGTLDPESLHDLAKAMDHAARAAKTVVTTPDPSAPPAAAAGKPQAPARIDADAAERARKIMGLR
ncbi:MAG TPA: phage protein Gp27 family protein [Stellaceae bacterium]|nr:phage protein Gp27 family protein [Stellaceae bacterium]